VDPKLTIFAKNDQFWTKNDQFFDRKIEKFGLISLVNRQNASKNSFNGILSHTKIIICHLVAFFGDFGHIFGQNCRF